MDNNMIFTRKTLVDATHVDRWGRMRPASLLEVMQETALTTDDGPAIFPIQW